MSILTFNNLSQSFADVDIFAGLNASVPNDARIGLVGPNGIGKTTLLRILAGETRPAGGQVHISKGSRIGYSQQEAMRAFKDQSHTIFQEMETVFEDLRTQADELRRMEARMGDGHFSDDLMARYGAAQEAFELAGGYDYELRIQQVLDGLGLGKEHWDMPLAHCSGGQKTRALLARLLLEEPELLILDEPTNHLDVAAIEWLENRLRTWTGALLIVSHDRYFLDKVANHIWEMSRNGIEEFRGNYSAYVMQREERWLRRDEEFNTTIEKFLKELDFVKRNIVRDSTTNRAKGRLRRLIRHVKAVEAGGVQALSGSWLKYTEEGPGISGEKWNMAEVERRIKGLQNPNPRSAQLNMRLNSGHRSGKVVLRTKDLEIGYPDVSLFRSDDIELYRTECVALIGPNGTGKTTFLRTLMGRLEPLSGLLKLGASLQVSYFAQAHDKLDPQKSVIEELLAYQFMPTSQARSYLARFLFRGEDVFKPISALSGGERGRLALALLALDKGNFLLLDEPTNHLDIPAQEVLQEALQHFEGTTLLVTHDRYLVDRLATQIWELRGGRLHVHKGNYQSYLAAREQARAEAAAVKEKRKPAPAVIDQTARQRERDLAQAESEVEDLEARLHQLNLALASATQEQDWEQVQELTQAHRAAHDQLEEMVERWEVLSQVVQESGGAG